MQNGTLPVAPRVTARALLLALGALLCLAIPGRASAQICIASAGTDAAAADSTEKKDKKARKRRPPRDGTVEVAETGCTTDYMAPTVSIDPGQGTFTAPAVSVTVSWTDNVGLDTWSHHIYLNGMDVTAQFSHSGYHTAMQSTGTVTLQPGQNTLVAEVWDQAGNYGSATAAYSYTPPAPPAPPATVTLPLLAPHSARADDPAQVSAGMVHPGAAVARDQCLSIAVAAGAAYECGDLRLAHALPTTRVLNSARTPVLIYNSQHAQPRPVLPFNVQMTPGGAPTSVRAVLWTSQVGQGASVRAQATWSDAAWASGGLWRFALSYDAIADPTNVYAYWLQVLGTFGGVEREIATYMGQLAVVNRSASPYGAGWWVAGMEHLVYVPGDGSFLRVGGDGSAQRYFWAAPGMWTATVVDRADTLWAAGPSFADGLYRKLPNGSVVWYDGEMRHARTTTRLGRTTSFQYTGNRLSAIVLPAASAAAAQYVFGYDDQPGRGWLSSVCARASDGSCRNTSVLHELGDARVTAIVDPDLTRVGFGYEGAGRDVRSRTDRRSITTSFAYDGAGKLRESSLVGHGRQGFSASESLGLGSGVPVANAVTAYDGPRLDVPDSMHVWVNRWGAPTRIRDAVGNSTYLTRGNPTFPALVTRVDYPNGRYVTAGHDAQGNLEAQTDWSHSRTLASGQTAYATTRYVRGNANWPNFVTQATMPEGESVRMEYDASGNRVWQQDGRGDSTRVHFTYTAGQLTAVQTEAARLRGEQPERYAYDAAGNLSRVTSPLGFYSEYFQNAIGLDTLVIAPVDGTRRLRTRRLYTAAGRDSITITMGDATEGNLHVETWYDAEGNPTQVSRWSTHDPRRIGKVTRYFGYDGAGRVTVENGEFVSAVSTEYDPAGNPIKVTNGLGSTKTTYDALNRPTQSITTGRQFAAVSRGIVEQYSGAVLGSDTYPAFPNGANGAFVIPADTTVFRYDPVTGAMLAADNSAAQIRRTYYPNGQLKTDTLRLRTWAGLSEGGNFAQHVYALEFGYDLSGRRSWMENPDAIEPVNAGTGQRYSRQEYRYEPAGGALAAVRNVLGLEYTFHYNAEGALVETRHPGSRLEVLTYDPDGRRTQRVLTSPNYNGVGTGLYTMSNARYKFDQRGMPSEALDGGQDPGASGSNYFKYTQLGRLYDVKGSGYGSGGATGTPAVGETYRWDALGNRLEHQQGEDAYPTISEYIANRLLRSHPPDGVGNSGQPYSTAEYDDNGNQEWFFADNFMVDVTDKSQTFQFRATRSYYGANGRLYASDGNHCYTEHAPGQQGTHCLGTAALRNETSGAFEWYRYDALGRRVMVRTRRDHNCTSTECSSTITRFVWDGDQILYEIQAPGGAVATNELESDNFPGNQYGRVLYTHGAGIDQPLDVIRMGHNPPAGYGFEAWGGPYPIMPFGDWRGTLVGGTTAQGVKLPCPDGKCLIYWPGSRYRAFLERDRPVYQRNWFGSLTAGQENPNGLMYMRNRYYNPITGAFTQTDPIGLAGGLNAYGYAAGNPVSYSDPFGLCADHQFKKHGFLGGLGIGRTTCPGGLSRPEYRRIEGMVRNNFDAEAGGRLQGMLETGNVRRIRRTAHDREAEAFGANEVRVADKFFATREDGDAAWILGHEMGHNIQWEHGMLISEIGNANVQPNAGRLIRLMRTEGLEKDAGFSAYQNDANMYACAHVTGMVERAGHCK